ncbi:MAG: DedA family protein [Patescibacteria group bacterium]|nr:DedA family protein [Patescibacteria group bacterium]
MNFLVQAILPYILIYKYLALFIITFIAALAIPIPSGTLLIASAAFSSQGYFSITKVLIVVILANILGDNTSYWLARFYGRKVLSRIGFINRILISKNFALIERGIVKHPGALVLVSRFEVVSTLTINFICGFGKTVYKKYLTFEILGTIASVMFYGMLGYIFGDSWQAINSLIGNFSLLIFLLIVLGVSLFWKKIIAKLKNNV